MKQKKLHWAVGLLVIPLVTYRLLYGSPMVSKHRIDPPQPPSVKQIRLLPLGAGCSPEFIRQTHRQLQRFIPSIQLSDAIQLPATAYYRPRGRYRADSLVHWMSRGSKLDEVVLGITSVDISTTKGDVADWGVMGLGFCPGNAAVASPYRMKNKSEFWKVAIHELGHTAGLPHCPVKSCFMRDAEGRNPTAEEKEFCSSCKRVLVNSGWRL